VAVGCPRSENVAFRDERDSGHWRARHWSKPQNNSPVPSTRLPTCLPHPHCVVAATERARLLIEQAKALGEPPEDPLLLYSVLYGLYVKKFIVFNGDAACTLATQFLTLAEKQRATIPVMIGHGLQGTALLIVGDLAEGLAHLDRAMALYDPVAHRPLATRFGQDIGVRKPELASISSVDARLSRDCLGGS
jgi:hypothetical protein